MYQLHNRADVEGTYEEITVEKYSELDVELSAIDIVKTADKKVWVKGELVFTIVVTNLDDRDPLDATNPGQPVTNVRVEDTLDIDTIVLDTTSVEIDGNEAILGTDFQYDPGTGIFVVEFPSIPARGQHTITFHVTRVP